MTRKEKPAAIEAPAESLVTFIPAQNFAGYPFDQKVDFVQGVESIPVPAEFAELMHAKGHVAPSRTETAPDAE
jgi:hypothetical protein